MHFVITYLLLSGGGGSGFVAGKRFKGSLFLGSGTASSEEVLEKLSPIPKRLFGSTVISTLLVFLQQQKKKGENLN